MKVTELLIEDWTMTINSLLKKVGADTEVKGRKVELTKRQKDALADLCKQRKLMMPDVVLKEGADEDKLEAWKEKVKKAHPEHAAKMKFKGRQEGGKDMICAEVPGLDRCFGVFDMDKLKGDVLGEAKLKWHDSDAPDANGKFRDLGVEALADWLIKTRGGDMQKITGSLNQQIAFNKKKDPAYAKKMESTREAVKRKLAAKKKD